MHILILYFYFGTPKGGWSTRIYELSRRWVQDGCRVTVITTLYDKSDLIKGKGLYHVIIIDGVTVYVINILQSNKHTFLKRIKNFLLLTIISTYLVLKIKSDVLITSSGPITVGISGIFQRFFSKRKFIFEVRDLWPDGAIDLGLLKNSFLIKLSYWLEKRCYIDSDLIITCSPGMYNEILDRYPFVSKKINVISNASDVALFNTEHGFILPIEFQQKKIFLYTGSIGLMDDCGQLIRAINNLKFKYPNEYKECVFIFFGEGSERAELIDLAMELDLSGNVKFPGLLPKVEVIGWLQNSYASLLSFKNIRILDTCSPNKLFDYMSVGLPVIQTTSGWIKDLVNNNEVGFNIVPQDNDSFSDAVYSLVVDVNLRDRMSENMRQLARNEYNRDHLARNYLALLKKCVMGGI